jgi:hypothetical protein
VVIDSPVVRIQPCGQLALAGAGQALMEFRGLAEVRAVRVAPVWLRCSRQSVSAACRYSSNHRAFGQRESALGASLRLAPPFRARPEDRRRPSRTGTPSRAFFPYSASRATGSVIAGLSQTRHLPSPAFRTPSTVCTPRPLPGLFRPGNAPGVPPSGACSSRESRLSLEVGALLSFGRPFPDHVKRPGARRATSEL